MVAVSTGPGRAESAHALAESLVDAMSAVRRAIRREAGAVAEVASLTGAQLQLVRVVRRQPGISVAEAAAELGVAPNTVSTLVHQLGAAGVLERHPSEDDRRVARLFLCPHVAEGLGEWVGRRSDAVAAALEAMADEDRDALAAAVGPLSRLAQAVGAEGRK
jgi:DNA-binding MarR family transcriptional regulator